MELIGNLIFCISLGLVCFYVLYLGIKIRCLKAENVALRLDLELNINKCRDAEVK